MVAVRWHEREKLSEVMEKRIELMESARHSIMQISGAFAIISSGNGVLSKFLQVIDRKTQEGVRYTLILGRHLFCTRETSTVDKHPLLSLVKKFQANMGQYKGKVMIYVKHDSPPPLHATICDAQIGLIEAKHRETQPWRSYLITKDRHVLKDLLYYPVYTPDLVPLQGIDETRGVRVEGAVKVGIIKLIPGREAWDKLVASKEIERFSCPTDNEKWFRKEIVGYEKAFLAVCSNSTR